MCIYTAIKASMNHIHYNLILGSDVLRGSDIRVDKIVTGRKHLDHVYGLSVSIENTCSNVSMRESSHRYINSFLAAGDCNLKVELEKTH